MKKILIAILFGVSVTHSISQSSFDGFYGSALAGKSAGNIGLKNLSSDWVQASGAIDPYQYLDVTNQSKNGWSGSLKFGYNRTVENNLAGIELGATFQDLSGTFTPTSYHQTNSVNDGSVLGFNVKTTINTYQTLALRLGRIVDEKILFYVSAGGAIGQLKNTASQEAPFVGPTSWWNANTSATNNQTKLGYVLGLGLEYNYSEDWSVRANYENVNFGNISSTYQGIYQNDSPIVYATNTVNFRNLSVGLTRRF